MRIVINLERQPEEPESEFKARGIYLCYRILYLVQRHLNAPGYRPEVTDFVALPKPNGYRSLHVTIMRNGQIMEVGRCASCLSVAIDSTCVYLTPSLPTPPPTGADPDGLDGLAGDARAGEPLALQGRPAAEGRGCVLLLGGQQRVPYRVAHLPQGVAVGGVWRQGLRRGRARGDFGPARLLLLEERPHPRLAPWGHTLGRLVQAPQADWAPLPAGRGERAGESESV